MLTMMKLDLEISLSETSRDARLQQYLDTARANITREGYTFSETLTLEEMSIIVQYAEWLWKSRLNRTGMPQGLRTTLNGMIFSQKMADSEE